LGDAPRSLQRKPRRQRGRRGKRLYASHRRGRKLPYRVAGIAKPQYEVMLEISGSKEQGKGTGTLQRDRGDARPDRDGAGFRTIFAVPEHEKGGGVAPPASREKKKNLRKKPRPSAGETAGQIPVPRILGVQEGAIYRSGEGEGGHPWRKREWSNEH